MTRNTNKFASGSPASLIVILSAVLIVVIGGVIFFAATSGNDSNESDSAMETSTSSPTTTTEENSEPSRPWHITQTGGVSYTSDNGGFSLSKERHGISVTLDGGNEPGEPIGNLFVVYSDPELTKAESLVDFNEIYQDVGKDPDDPTGSRLYKEKNGNYGSAGGHLLTFSDPNLEVAKVCQNDPSSQKCIELINANDDPSNIEVNGS